MKKTIIKILIAILIGFILGILFLKKYDNTINLLANSLNEECYAFQIGVFKNYDNALKLSQKYNGIVVNDEEYYRVFIDIVKDKQLLNDIEEYYKNKNINYYLKPIKINESFKETLDSYEMLLKSSETTEYEMIIENILKEYIKIEQNKGFTN